VFAYLSVVLQSRIFYPPFLLYSLFLLCSNLVKSLTLTHRRRHHPTQKKSNNKKTFHWGNEYPNQSLIQTQNEARKDCSEDIILRKSKVKDNRVVHDVSTEKS
jgi:hypothetical protein